MKRARFMATVALAAAGAITTAAQESRTPADATTTGDQNRTNQQTPTQTTPANQGATGLTTVTGCIQRSGQGATQTYTLMASSAGAAATASAGANIGARTEGAAPSAGARTGGAAGQTQPTRPGQSTSSGETASAAGMTYTLEGSEVAKHVGHQVELTGTLAAMGTGNRAGAAIGAANDRAGNAAGGNDRSAVGTSGASGDRQTLRVTSVKMLSTTCSR